MNESNAKGTLPIRLGIRISMIEPDGFTFVAGILVGIAINILTGLVGSANLTADLAWAVPGSILIAISAFICLSLATSVRFLRDNAEWDVGHNPDKDLEGTLADGIASLSHLEKPAKMIRELPKKLISMFIVFVIGLVLIVAGPRVANASKSARVSNMSVSTPCAPSRQVEPTPDRTCLTATTCPLHQ